MDRNSNFLHMFSDYEPPEALKSALSQAAIVAADIDPNNRSIQVALSCDTYIPARLLELVSKDLREIYHLRSITIEPVFPATELPKIE